MEKKADKILIRGVNWIGDAVLTIPALRAVRKKFPDAHISLLVKPWVAELFKGNPDVNEIILYDEKFNSITGKVKLAMTLRGKKFTTAILFQNAFDAAFIAWLARIPERIGYTRDYRRLLLTQPVPVNRNTLNKHHVDYYLNLLKESFHVEPGSIEPLLYLSEDEINQARNLLNSKLQTHNSELLIGINPGATYGSAKRWMTERFAELINRIINEYNAKVVLFGSKSEIEIARDIVSYFTLPGSHILNMAGKTNLRELAALISECDVLITNDSGPMHMASALHVPVVAIFGSTDKSATGPLGKGHKIVSKEISCSPCLEKECPVSTTHRGRFEPGFPEGHLKCMTDITTEDVLNAFKEVVPKEKAVFLDRDGTLNEDVGYLNSFENLKIFSGTPENLRRLKNAGFKLIGITNQSGIARGIVSEEFVQETNEYLQKTLTIDDFYYCPHHPDNGCPCRKPKPMLLRKARLEHGINLKSSYVIGDKTIDVFLAKGVGAQGILVMTGHDKESKEADFIAQNLGEAVDWILEQEKLRKN